MQQAPRGKMHVYLGIAPGAGKTWAMLAEGRRLAAAGLDVVVGLVDTHGRSDTAAAVDGLEVVPAKVMSYRGTVFPEMDVDAVLARRPDVALVDELAHTNVSGSRHEKRWQDVEEIRQAGIDVVTNLNVQHLEGVGDAVEQRAGVAQRETVPDVVVAGAWSVELVDVEPGVLRARVRQGDVHGADRAAQALDGYFSLDNLAMLRRLALRWLRAHDLLSPDLAAAPGSEPERVIVALPAAPGGEHVVRRAAALAAGLRAELIGAHVREASGLVEAESAPLASERRLVALLGGSYAEIAGTDPARSILEFTRLEGAGHLVVATGLTPRRDRLFHGGVVARVLRRAGAVEVHVVPSRPAGTPAQPGRRPARSDRRRLFELRGRLGRRRVSLPPRRLLLGWLLAVLAPVVVIGAAVPFRSSLGLAGALFCALLAVVLVSVVGGLFPGLLATVVSFLMADFFFAVPLHSLRVDRLIDLVALIAFAAVAIVVGILVDVLTRQGLRAARGRAEAESVTRLLADSVAAAPQLLPDMTASLRRTFDLDTAATLRSTGEGWVAERAVGSAIPTTPEQPPSFVRVDEGRALVLVPDSPTDAAEGLLPTFIDQLSLNDRQKELQRLRSEPACGVPAGQDGDGPSIESPSSGANPSGTKRMPEPGSVMK